VFSKLPPSICKIAVVIQNFFRATIDKLNRELDLEKAFQYKVTAHLRVPVSFPRLK
jgi:hypothetical protein